MIFYHSPYKQAIALLSVTVLCSGFSWGLGKPAPCTDAGATIANLSTISDPGKRMKQEESIVKTCPDGAAALYIKALQAEKTSSPDAAITLYREALAKDDKISEAHGNLGLLLLDRSLENEASVELAKGLMGRPDPRYHRAMARIMNNGSFPSLALYHFGEALKAFPEDAEIHIRSIFQRLLINLPARVSP